MYLKKMTLVNLNQKCSEEAYCALDGNFVDQGEMPKLVMLVPAIW